VTVDQSRGSASPPIGRERGSTRRRGWMMARMTRSQRRRPGPSWLFVAPALALLTGFWLVPIGVSIYIAFTDWAGLGDPEWIGLDNFRGLFDDQAFHSAAANTVWYSVGMIALLIPLGIGVALVMNSPSLRGRFVYRSILFIPGVATTVAVAISFLLILDTKYGLLNDILGTVGIGPVPWLTDPGTSKAIVLGFVVWGSIGFTMIYFLAGLQAIPRETVEAAQADGARKHQIFWHIVLPQLRPALTFVLVITTINALQILAEPYVLTDGGPNNSSLSAGLLLYKNGLTQGRLGYASAIGLVIFVVTIVVSLAQLRFLRVFKDD
jgi:ABC-type sugar transport system permease subunit